MFALVAVLTNIPRVLSYKIADDVKADIAIGSLVFVPLREKIYAGFVIGINNAPPDGLKEERLFFIHAIAPYPPFFDNSLLEFYKFVSSYYGAPLGMVLKMAFPNAGRYKVSEQVLMADSSSLGPLLQIIADKKISSTKELCKFFPDLTRRQIKELEEKGIIKKNVQISFKTFSPKELKYIDFADDKVISHTEEQAAIVSSILANLTRHQVHLLYGKTGTGKTELLLNLAAGVLHQGKSVLYLVPEITMVPHIYKRALSLIPPEKLIVWHSSIKNDIRGFGLEKIMTAPSLVIGTRSAIFLPLHKAGIVIVDEEHDGSYKHEGQLPYNARDMAIMRGKTFSHPVVLSSATPSLETYHRAKSGAIITHSLTNKFSPQKPEVILVDTGQQKLLHDFFSHQLLSAIADNLNNNQQSLIFINRRGYAPYIYCDNCKKFILCNNCAVPLVWHKRKNSFVCHRCAKVYRPLNCCPLCNSHRLSFFGAGTERVVEALEQLFPQANILKIDRDATDNTNFFKKHLPGIVDGQFNILVGTQIITKGHHFPLLTLVGVLMGDQGMSMPDFRAQERSFQLLTQVFGRSGRELPGKVLIQTAYPDSPAINFAIKEDLEGFYNYDMKSRQDALFPPIVKLLLIKTSSPEQEKARQTAEQIYTEIKASPLSKSIIAFPPIPAPILKEKGRYRFQLYVKAHKPQPLMKLIQHLKQGVKINSAVRVNYDMDPYNMM
jgi:primosomal protein N' (replication factor Y)